MLVGIFTGARRNFKLQTSNFREYSKSEFLQEATERTEEEKLWATNFELHSTFKFRLQGANIYRKRRDVTG
jgi:hypothetical protein